MTPQRETLGIDELVSEEVRDGCRIATHHLAAEDEPRRIGVSSALRAEGRTTIALGMAFIQSQERGRRTILLEMDLENPSLAERIGVRRAPGLAELVDGGASLDSCIRWITEDIGVLPAGDLRRSPARVVAEMRRVHLLELIEARCDVIVADLPPVFGSTVGTHVTDLFAPLVLVVRAGSTPVAQVQQAIRELPVQPTVLLNQRASAMPSWLRRSLDDW